MNLDDLLAGLNEQTRYTVLDITSVASDRNQNQWNYCYDRNHAKISFNSELFSHQDFPKFIVQIKQMGALIELIEEEKKSLSILPKYFVKFSYQKIHFAIFFMTTKRTKTDETEFDQRNTINSMLHDFDRSDLIFKLDNISRRKPDDYNIIHRIIDGLNDYRILDTVFYRNYDFCLN